MPTPSLSSYNKYTGYLRKSVFSNSAKTHLYLELLLNLLAIAFFGWFAIRPTIITITDLLQEIEIKRDIAIQLDKKIDALLAANTTYKTASPQLPLLDEALPTQSQVTEFTAQIEQLMNQASVEFVNFGYNPFPLDKPIKPAGTEKSPSRSSTTSSSSTTKQSPETNVNWHDLEFELSVNGAYGHLRQLISTLYQLRRVVLTQDITMQLDPRNLTDTNTLTLRLVGKILYL